MMPALNEVMLALSSSLAASIVAKVTVTTALALIATRLARRSRAAVRHSLIAAAFGVLLALPVASILIPSVRIAVQPAAPERSFPASAAAAVPAQTSVSDSPAAPRPAAFSPSALLLAAWIAGMALFLMPVAVGLWQVRKLRRSALPWRHGQSLADRLAFDAGVHRRVEVLLHDRLPGPMTCGVLHPAIVLSEDAQNWDAEDLNRAIVHELEHVRRGDWVSLCLARAVCAAYWFHPLVWIAWRRLALEAERSCDDAVLRRSAATAYADQLVGLARRMSNAAKSPVLAMANRADLTTRVGAVLDSRQQRGRAGTLTVALACAAAAALVVTMSPLRVVAAQQSGSPAAGLPQFVANLGLVIDDVTVTDQNGTAIEGLTAKDFTITEDGVPQTISVFEFQKLTAQPGTPDSVSSYYILGYYTKNQRIDDATFRNIRIDCTTNLLAKVRYRPGYYARKVTRAGVSIPGTASADSSIGAASGAVPDPSVPILISKVEPEYSEAARKAKYQGTVTLNVEVSAAGQVTSARVVKSLGLGLDEKAIDAVKQWKFRPAMKDGQPVAAQAQAQLSFRLL